MINRRRLLLGSLGLSSAMLLSPRWVAAKAEASHSPPRLVVVFLRGAIDGLNVVVPYGQAQYYQHRPDIAIARPGQSGGVFDLDGTFGLHPALVTVIPFWQQGQLAFVHASGCTDPSRSHFDAQDNMETGTPGFHATPSGWLNRLAGSLPIPGVTKNPSMRMVSVGPALPRIASGPSAVTTIAQGGAAARAGALDQEAISKLFANAYAGDPKMGPILESYMDARPGVRASLEAADDHAKAANMGAPADYTFGADAVRLGAMMRRDPEVRLGFLSVSGWDTHSSQAGQLTAGLGRLGSGLTALVRELGPVYSNTVIVVMSEFGRSVAQNGSLGTDHGHGNVMWLLGGRVAGGRVYADWPGLSQSELFEKRDLAVTTDFRSVLAQVLQQHLFVGDQVFGDVFPRFKQTNFPFQLLKV